MTLQVYRDKAQRRRWIVVSSSDALDRDKEIIPVEALKADAERAKQTGEYGPLLWWHVKGLELGTCDFNEMAGNKLVESGTFKSEAIADFVEKNADQLGVSIGFVHSPNDPGPDGVFKAIRRTERSLLPAQRASNPDARVLAVKGKGTNVTVRDVKQTHKWGPFVEMMFGGDEKAAEEYLAQFGTEAGKSAGPDTEKAIGPNYLRDKARAIVEALKPAFALATSVDSMAINNASNDVKAGYRDLMRLMWEIQSAAGEFRDATEGGSIPAGIRKEAPADEKGAQHPGDLTPAKVRELEQAASRVLDALTAVGGDMETLGRASVSFGGRYLSAYQQAQTAIRSAYQACIAMNSEAHEQSQIYRVAGKEAPEKSEKAAEFARLVTTAKGLLDAMNDARSALAQIPPAAVRAAGVAPRWQMTSSAVYAAHAAAAEFRNAVENADGERDRAMGKEAGKSRDGGEQWDNDGWGDGVDPATVMKQPPAGKFGDHDPISALMGGKE